MSVAQGHHTGRLLRRAALGVGLVVLAGLAACALPSPPSAAASDSAERASPNAPAAAAPGGAHGAGRGPQARGPAPPTAALPGPPGQPPAAAPGQGPQRPAPRPFDTVVQGATRHDGFLPLWEREGQWWVELAPQRLNQPFLLSVNVTRSVGERGLYAGQMGPSWLVELQQHGQQFQFVARNLAFRGEGDPAIARTAQQGYSDSLLAAMPAASAPRASDGAVLIEASFLLGDLPGYTRSIERAFRIGYQIDGRNSRIDRVRSHDTLTAVHTTVHYATARIPLPPTGPQAATAPQPPATTPDPRSLLVGFVYNFSALPAQPLRPRAADPRVGHFTTAYTDLTRDGREPSRVHLVQRWRLEPQDPAAAASPPRQPIEFWLDRNIPRRYIEAVEAGVLAWNEAFARIGLPGAIVTRRQGEDEADDGMEASRASIRWYSGADAGFSIGPSHSDPRTGEILSAHIAISDTVTRGARRSWLDLEGHLGEPGAAGGPGADAASQRLARLTAPWRQPLAWIDGHFNADTAACTFAAQAADELHQALDTLIARDGLDPDDPRIEEFVREVLKELVMHEVGHTLGLRHNFKASAAYSLAQLRDPAFTQSHGLSASVMDYNPVNLGLRDDPPTRRVNARLGPYDLWAIEYAYRPVPVENEAQALAAIAARSAEDPLLAYADDTDAGGFRGVEGVDPLASRFDLSADPLGHAQHRVALAQDVWQRVQTQPAQNAQDLLRQRRALGAGFGYLQGAAAVAVKYIGGLAHDRSQLGDAARPPGRLYTPVDPREQARALTLLTDALFRAESFRFEPRFLASLPPDHLDREPAGPVDIPGIVLRLQSATLDRLYAPGTARRLLDLPGFGAPTAADGAGAGARPTVTLAGVFEQIQSAVWSELRAPQDIPRLRRDLQREHLRRVQALLTGRSPAMPADAVSLTRYLATRLQAQLREAAQAAERAPRGVGIETRAHLQESLALLTQALQAGMQRD